MLFCSSLTNAEFNRVVRILTAVLILGHMAMHSIGLICSLLLQFSCNVVGLCVRVSVCVAHIGDPCENG